MHLYPFTAVVGLDNYKLALILNAIDPSIGGVLVSGPRGVAKSTLARSCTALLASSDDSPSEFVTLPLGATEEMLIGSLDIEGVLHEQKIQFKSGLLAKAHQGILYVDEVNLLPDLLVDQLLDVAASGINTIERDGVSHQHDARFILLGTMNPDEGELRSQLLDRFGFCVELSNNYDIDERVRIVELREKFECDPVSFIAQFQQEQDNLFRRVQEAKQLIPNIVCDVTMQREIAKACIDADVDGLRADIVWIRAAKAHAAWRYVSNSQSALSLSVTEADVSAVEPLVLQHRRNNQKQPPTPPASPPPFQRPPESQSSDNSSQQSQSENSGDWGAMQPEQQSIADQFTITSLDANRPSASDLIHSSYLSEANSRNNKTGNFSGGKHRAVSDSLSPDWLKTVGRYAREWPPKSLLFKKQKQQSETVHLVLLDTSASVLMGEGFSKAKAFLLAMAKERYLLREQLSIIGFGNDEVKTLLPQRRAEKNLSHFLEGLTAGGGTPFLKMLDFAVNYIAQLRKKMPSLQLFITIISDGCSQQTFQKSYDFGVCRFIDVEQSVVKRGKGKQIASYLNAEYCVLT